MSSFFRFCQAAMTKELLESIAEATADQCENSDWYSYRIARITASVCYEASRSTTYEGSLKERIMGYNAPFESAHMKRGKKLEKRVLLVLEKKYGPIKKSGLYLSAIHPHLGASPDGVQNDRVFEIKCPSSINTLQNYISESGAIHGKWIAQMHLQMYLSNKHKAIFCVAKPAFERNEKIENLILKEVTFNKLYFNTLLRQITSFWQTAIYTTIKEQYLFKFK